MIEYVTPAMEPVDVVQPLAGYRGGKRLLATKVGARIDAVPHRTYAEAFVGMGGVFFRRTSKPPCEVINDWSEDVSTFFRVIQHHYVPFMDMIRHQISSRSNFEKLAALEPASLTDLQRSARFLYVQRMAFGGGVGSRSFGASPGNTVKFDVSRVGPMIEAVHERLQRVLIERLRWQDFVARYDRAETLFYLDPPYYGHENDYGRGLFERAEFEEMAEQLAGIKGRFILSLNDHPDVRRIFARFDIEAVRTKYTAGRNNGAKAQGVGELLISN